LGILNSILKTKEERGPLWKFGSVQIGYAAAFGGLGFALRALGIGIPIAPGMLMDPRDVVSIIGPGFAGPIGAIIIGILCALPSAVFCVQVYVPMSIIFALIFHYFKHPWYFVPMAGWMLTFYNAYWAWWYQIWGFIPVFWIAFLASFTLTVVYIPACILLIEILRRYSPTAKRIIG
jgi:hypothetical protein